MDAVGDVLRLAAEHAARFHGTLDDRQVHARATVAELAEALGGPLPEAGAADDQVLAELLEHPDGHGAPGDRDPAAPLGGEGAGDEQLRSPVADRFELPARLVDAIGDRTPRKEPAVDARSREAGALVLPPVWSDSTQADRAARQGTRKTSRPVLRPTS